MTATASSGTHLTVEDVLRFLMPATLSGEKPLWPPDAYALAASILKHCGAYTEIVNVWPPPPSRTPEAWQKRVQAIASQWHRSYARKNQSLPADVERWWKTILSAKASKLDDVRHNTVLLRALVAIIAAADETCEGIGILPIDSPSKLLKDAQVVISRGTLCKKIHRSRVAVLPKLHNSYYGMTLRSLTHNLALWDTAEVSAFWENSTLEGVDDRINILVIPWPHMTNPNSFRALKGRLAEKMPKEFGFFSYDPGDQRVEPDYVLSLVAAAERTVGKVHAIAFPELSMDSANYRDIRLAVGNTLVIAGVGSPAAEPDFGENFVAIGLGASRGSVMQSKHHRWRVDKRQLSQYGIDLRTQKKHLWEAIEMVPRECTFFNVNEWLTFCVLICEDLARQDPVAELVRSVGPNLVLALLMDGPQIPERWSSRYATVLADDPRCSVLTLTCAGLVDLACSQSGRGPRSIGLWKDAESPEARKVVLEPGAEAIVLALDHTMEGEWTADGRYDGGGTGYVNLTGIYQVMLDGSGGKGTRRVVETRRKVGARDRGRRKK
jgi:hypothetical protein